MMGHQFDYQQKLFVTGFNLEKRIRRDHILRKIAQTFDCDFIYQEAKDTYRESSLKRPSPISMKLTPLPVPQGIP